MNKIQFKYCKLWREYSIEEKELIIKKKRTYVTK
ncbi:MAG: hypothetical protein PWP56_1483 [Acetobacterium sp.]|nr:hypothetical protein [Acetobacterium sp.]